MVKVMRLLKEYETSYIVKPRVRWFFISKETTNTGKKDHCLIQSSWESW